VRAQKQRGVPCLEVAPDVFRSLAFKDVAQGIGAVVHQRWERWKRSRSRRWADRGFALDGVQYPGNLGTILRTCDAVGGGGVFLLGHATDPYDPAAVRASMGGVFTQRLVRTRFDEFAAWKGQRGVTVAGTSPSAPTDYRTVPYRPPFVLLMGCERGGLSAEHQAACDVMVRIPMVGRCDSLNLAISTGVVLYEAFHQSRAAGY
jgi:TrmH family RNA methyltransferase